MDSLLTDIAKRDGISKGVASKVIARRIRGLPFAGFNLTVGKPKKEKERKREQRVKFL